MKLATPLRALGLAGVLSAGPAGADIVTVVSADNPVGTLTRSEVSNIFLGKTRQFPDGRPALPIDQPEGSPKRTAFYTAISNKQAAELKAYWSKMIFTGRGQPPPIVDNDEAVKARLARQPNAIGYIDDAALDARVNAVAVR
jgi:ABC-type phosphate transport system substrate-binding protein